MRNSSYFKKLLNEFESSSIRGRSSLLERMEENAKTFADWYEIHRYGDSSAQYEALQKMKELVLKQQKVLDIQRNILDLFELMTDSKEQEQILKAYLEQHCEKDDILFVLTVCDTACDLWSDAHSLALKYYSTYGGVSRGIQARQNKNVKIMTP